MGSPVQVRDRVVGHEQVRERPRADRLAAAQRALATAEASAGLRQRLTGVTAPRGPERAAGESGGRAVPEIDEAPVEHAVPSELLLPLPAGLEPLLPAGGIRRGTALQVSGSTSLLLALAAAAARGGEDTWCAVVAIPDLGLAAAAEAGLDLDRTLVVPRPGPGAPAVLGALVDGFDVVVLGRCPALTDADRRQLGHRLRSREAVLLAADPWPGAQAVLEVGGRTWAGVGAGDGVLTGSEVTVTALARGAGRSRSARVRLGGSGGLVVVEGAGREQVRPVAVPAPVGEPDLARAG